MKFTLCGSAKFECEYHMWNKKLTALGHIVYSLVSFPSIEGSKSWYTPEEKELLDLAHLAKIEESDAILVLNKDDYVGESTRREVIWASMRGKMIFWLEDSELCAQMRRTRNGIGNFCMHVSQIPNHTGPFH